MFLAAFIGILTLTGWVSYAWLACIALCIGITNAFDMPVRQSIVVYLVDNKDDMPNALALNSSLFNVARLIGPSVAGVTIHQVGEGICFLLNSVAYSSTIFAVKTMKITRSTVATKSRGGLRSVFSAFSLLRGFPPFAHILAIVLVAGVFGVPYLALMPAMARTVLSGTSRTMGILLMCVGAGALAGSLVMAARRSPVGLDRWASRFSVMFGVTVALFALSRVVWLSMLLLVPVGFFMVTGLIACNTFLQSLVDNENRSGLMSLYVAAMTGVAPVGSILVGWLGEIAGTSLALCASGIVCAALIGYFASRLQKHRRLIHRAFRSRGFHLKEGKNGKERSV
jgi:predicted MFS family arabinose efflux permease